MSKKKQIHLFFRKPFFGLNFSIENFYLELIKNFQHKDVEFKVKVCPLESKGILKRILINIAVAAGAIGLCSTLQAKQPTKNMNVIFIELDDLNDWVGAFGGHEQALTPNMEYPNMDLSLN
mgnify:CR=1 FL=1